MSINHFNSHLWSDRLQDSLHKALAFGNLCSPSSQAASDHCGDTIPIVPASQPTGAKPLPSLDRCTYFNFFINNADTTQRHSELMDAAVRMVAYRLAADVDVCILSVIRAGAGCRFTKRIPSSTGDGLYALLLEIKNVLDSAGVPRLERKLVLPSVLESLLLPDSRFITDAAGADDRLAKGAAARAAGFDIYISSALTNEIIALLPDAVSHSSRITSVEAYRLEKGSHDGVKGICLSGAKVLLPSAVCICTISP